MKYIIVGAVAGGASTAARLRRLDEHAEIIIFEKGQYISYANCGLPYYIGEVIKERDKLFVQTPTSFNLRFNIDVRINTEVTGINAAEKTIKALDLKSGKEYEESYDKLVLSPGAQPLRPPIPGINGSGIFTLRNVDDTDFIKKFVENKKGGHAVIVGAGFIGLEMAENLHNIGMQVSIVEMSAQVLTPVDFPIAALAQKVIREKGVGLFLKNAVVRFEPTESGQKVILNSGISLEADLVILSIGVRPDTRLADDAGLQLGEAKGIYVNEFLQTSDSNIYAVGDAIEFKNPISGRSMITYLAGPANKQGRICANNIVSGNTEHYKGSINTAIVQVFGLTIGTTGMASKHLTLAGIEHIVSTTTNNSHAGYYPGAKSIVIQIAFSPNDGTLFGAQVIGYDGADKRLDILASVIKNRGTIADLAEFEHAYAPPYSSAKDPINMAGFTAENILTDRLHVFYWNELDKITGNDILVDVRSPEEYSAGKIGDAINIPVDELRGRLNELKKADCIYIYCEAGLRGYLAQRILRQNGFERVYNLSGGYRLWLNCVNELV